MELDVELDVQHVNVIARRRARSLSPRWFVQIDPNPSNGPDFYLYFRQKKNWKFGHSIQAYEFSENARTFEIY